MICESCGQDRPIAARGLCRTCYGRWQKGGTVDYIRPLKNRVCSVEGCLSRVHGQGLCSKHLLRLRRTGTTDEGRSYTHQQRDPDNLRSTHDLYPVWAEFKRKKNPRPVVPGWLDFDVFISQVVPRPGRRWRIYGIDRNQPMGPDNYIWKESSVEKLPGESDRDYAARQRLAHRAMYPNSYKDANLRRTFGPDFGFDQYAVMAEAQNNLCAITGKHETALGNAGERKHLAVDHNHQTDAIRQLLTTNCNTGIGLLGDDIPTLIKAALYLAKHDPEGNGQAKIDAAIAYLQRHPVASLDKDAILPQT